MGSLAQVGKPTGDGLAARLWQAAEHVALESLHSPFVTAMAQGTLPRSAFQHYVSQDAFFLQFFARAYAMAMCKCDPEKLGQKAFDKLAELLRGVHEELRLHTSFALGWGVDLAAVRPSPATLAYTDFLMQVADDPSMGLAEVLCAMAPCARLYGFLGCHLKAAFPDASHAYVEWIDTYSSEAYMEVPVLKESMMEQAAAVSQSDEGKFELIEAVEAMAADASISMHSQGLHDKVAAWIGPCFVRMAAKSCLTVLIEHPWLILA